MCLTPRPRVMEESVSTRRVLGLIRRGLIRCVFLPIAGIGLVRVTKVEARRVLRQAWRDGFKRVDVYHGDESVGVLRFILA
jgi:hypothetical protein